MTVMGEGKGDENIQPSSDGSLRAFSEGIQFCTDSQTLIGLTCAHSKVDKIPWSRPPKWYFSIFSAQTVLHNPTQDR